MKLGDALRSVLGGETLTREEARAVFTSALSEEADPIQLAGLLSALALRGETREELVGAAEALRSKMTRFEHERPDAIDTCGTGGDGLGSFNVSTAAALVACAAGACVVKHGNRSASSRCGSADLLEAAGVAIELEPERARAVLDAVGITFLFAPSYHPAMRFAAPVRRSLGVPTLFNRLGPLCNPGGVKRQLLGVNERERVHELAAVLAALGHERAYVVHGGGGADELTTAGANHVARIGELPEHAFDAASLGLERAPVEALAGGDPAENARLLETLLDGAGGAIADAVILNAAAALVVAGLAGAPEDGVALAREALASGAARAKLDSWRRASGGRS